jgi:hypothetical protein
MSALKAHRAGGMQRAGLMAEDTSRADGPLSQVESGLTAAATFAHRQIEFVRPHSAANARAPSVADNNAATKSTVVNKHGDEVSISVYRPANDAAATVNSKDDFKEPSLSLFKAERVEAWLKWKNVRSIGCGLNNLGNTCFLVRFILFVCISFFGCHSNTFLFAECRVAMSDLHSLVGQLPVHSRALSIMSHQTG